MFKNVQGKRNRLIQVVNHAYSTVPYYMNRGSLSNRWKEKDIREILNEIPILEKNQAVMESDKLFSSTYMADLYRNNLLKLHTSGSTGKCMGIYWDKSDYQRSLIPLYQNRKQIYDVKSSERFCYFYTSRDFGKSDKMMERNPQKIGFCKSDLTEERLLKVYEEIQEFGVTWIMTQPSIMILLCDIREKYGLPTIPSVRYIELTGEMLFPLMRQKILKNFNNAKIANHYGTMEVNSIAFEKNDEKLHISNTVYVEIIDEEGNLLPNGIEGDICVTSLDNFCMPFIRYRVGDRGRLIEGEEKKEKEKILELTTGRINDYVLLENGERVNSYIFVRAINNTNEYLDGPIYQFCIIQKEINDFIVQFVIDDEIERSVIMNVFKDNILQSGLENARFQFEFCDNLFPDDEKGKMRYFISEVRSDSC